MAEEKTIQDAATLPEAPDLLRQDGWFGSDLSGYWLQDDERYEQPVWTLSWCGIPFAPLGNIHALTGQSWMNQQYVLEVPGMYPRKMVFEVFGEDRIKTFNIQEGQEVTVSFEIDAHQYQDRWFNEIRAWDVRPTGQQQAPTAQSVASNL